MSKQPSEDLFQLIQSLTQSEKKYFKRFSNRHTAEKENLYSKLFDALAKTKYYNEEKFIKKNSPVVQNYFADQKQKLYQLVLRSETNFHFNATIDLEIYHHLSAAAILIQKKLFQQAKKIIDKSIQKALHYERFTLALELLGMERQFILSTMELEQAKEKLRELQQETIRITRLFLNANEYRKLSEEMYFILSEERFLRSKKNKALASKMKSMQLLREPRLALSIDAKLSFHRAHGFYNYMSGNPKAFYEHNLEILQLIKGYPYLLQNSFRAQITAYQNILIGLKNMGEFDRASEMLLEFRKLETHSIEEETEIFSIATDIQLTLFIDTGNFSMGVPNELKLKNDLEKYRSKIRIDTLAIIYFNMAYILIGAGKFKSALQWIGKIINDKNFEAPTDASVMSRLLSLLINYELHDYDYLEYCLKPASKFIVKNDKFFQLEKVLLGFFKNIIGTNRQEKKMELFHLLRKDLKAIEKDEVQKLALNYFDYLSWCESKISGKSLEETVTSKMK